MRIIVQYLLIICFSVVGAIQANSVKTIFEHDYQTQLLMHIEASLAEAQAKHDIIPTWAAKEIRAKADSSLVTEAEFQAEFERVRHRMVTLLNVWGSKMQKGAEQYLHFGATTVDIYDSLMVLQLNDAIALLVNAQLTLEKQLMLLAKSHAKTIMVGRTLGQHALPITFGKKVSSWLAENRRNINRLKTVQAKLRQSAILKGAVGSYLGLGDKGPAVEIEFAKQLGLDKPYADDWHAARDVFAEYALTLAIISKSLARIGQEVFLMQSTDLAEVVETRPGSAVSSSSMPHKKNPSRSEALMHYGRTIPANAEVILNDMVNFYERDNTSRPNIELAQLSIAAGNMLNDSIILFSRLTVYPDQMRSNLNRTKGLITAQRLVFALSPHIGKQVANEHIHKIAQKTYQGELSFRENLMLDSLVSKYLSKEEIQQLTDISNYLGQDEALIEAVVKKIEAARKQDSQNDN